ncbi:MAG: sulfurtransferase TusA family protein [Candidatus Korarchaeota archaeon]|nr:sulfurtransferase TusA family protein [Candidatus Korarchaeota archaeon]
MSDAKPDKTLDARGLMCPLPVVRASQAIKEVPVGGVLEILATDPGALSDIPAWAKSQGHEVLSVERNKDKIRFLIKRTK